jgi:hypothetical protein
MSIRRTITCRLCDRRTKIPLLAFRRTCSRLGPKWTWEPDCYAIWLKKATEAKERSEAEFRVAFDGFLETALTEYASIIDKYAPGDDE